MMGRTIHVPDSVQGLIFDCDGTLVDSMPLHMKAWEEALLHFDARFEYDFFFSRKGMKEAEIVGQYNAAFHASLDAAAVVERKHYHFRHHIADVKRIKPVAEIVYRYDGMLPMAVVSGGVRDIVDEELRVAGLRHYFPVILTADDPIAPKPSPDIFLEAARRLSVAPSLCHVFEDGDIGITAAKAAGMTVSDVRFLTGG